MLHYLANEPGVLHPGSVPVDDMTSDALMEEGSLVGLASGASEQSNFRKCPLVHSLRCEPDLAGGTTGATETSP